MWFSGDCCQLASDSRLSVKSDDLTVDTSVKVNSFTLRIPRPQMAGHARDAMFVNQEVGLVAAGDVATTLVSSR